MTPRSLLLVTSAPLRKRAEPAGKNRLSVMGDLVLRINLLSAFVSKALLPRARGSIWRSELLRKKRRSLSIKRRWPTEDGTTEASAFIPSMVRTISPRSLSILTVTGLKRLSMNRPNQAIRAKGWLSASGNQVCSEAALFRFTDTGWFDGAAAEGHCAILFGLLQRWGDRPFPAVLRAQQRSVRKAVIDSVAAFPACRRNKFPLTYASAPH